MPLHNSSSMVKKDNLFFKEELLDKVPLSFFVANYERLIPTTGSKVNSNLNRLLGDVVQGIR